MPDDPFKTLSSPITELAKAEQEQQKTIQAAIGLTDKAATFLGRVFGHAADEFGLALGERTRFWRFKNLNKMMLKIDEMAQQRALHPDAMKALPFGMAVRVMDAASNEEEESVQDLWARLTTNAIDPSMNVNITKVHVNVLRSISPPEAALLDLLWQIAALRTESLTMAAWQPIEKKIIGIADEGWRKYDVDARRIAIQNLVRLRCATSRPRQLDTHNLLGSIDRHSSQWAAVDAQKFIRVLQSIGELIEVASGIEDPQARAGSIPEMAFILTPLGRGLMHACRGKELPAT